MRLALQADRPPSNAAYARSNEVYWRGYWWCGEFTKSAGSTGLYVRAACPAGMAAIVASIPERLTYRGKVGAAWHETLQNFALRLTLNTHSSLQASYKIVLQLGDGAPVNVAFTNAFRPATVNGWGVANIKDSSGKPITWERFLGIDSPLLRDGRAHMELQLSVPRS